MPIADDEIPLKPSLKNRARFLQRGVENTMYPTFYDGPHGPIDADPSMEPIDAFDQFFTDDVLDMIVKQTNTRAEIELSREVHAKLIDDWVALTREDINKFILILLLMSMKKLPALRDYWRRDWLGLPVVRSVMSRRRFEQIKHCLMVANPTQEENEEDKLAKARPFLDLVKTIIQGNYNPGTDQSLDESQIKCGHRHCRFGYRGKSHKPLSDYINSIAANDSKSGYAYTFKIDLRLKGQKVADHVMDVLAEYPEKGKGFRFWTDRLYTTIDTMTAAFRKFGAYLCGTIKSDAGPHRTEIAADKQKLEDGEFLWQCADLQIPITFFLWRDSAEKGSWFASTFHGSKSSTVRRRKRGAETNLAKPCPKCAKEYNENMGACDRCNALRASYSMHLTHKQRWYMSLVYYGLDILFVDSFIYYRDGATDGNKLSQKQYRIKVIEALFTRCKVSQQLDAVVVPPPQGCKDDIRVSGNCGGYPCNNGSRGICIVCSKKKGSLYAKSHKVMHFCSSPACTTKQGKPMYFCIGDGDENCWKIGHTVKDLDSLKP